MGRMGGVIKLEPRGCPQSSTLVSSIDPQPEWSFDDLLSELNSLEELHLGSLYPSPLKKHDHEATIDCRSSPAKPFVMTVSDDDTDTDADTDTDDQEPRYDRRRGLVTGTRFSFNDLHFSESEEEEEESDDETKSYLMEQKSLEEGILFELEQEHEIKVKEQLRSKLSALELYQKNESERSLSSILQLEKYAEARREMDRRVDKQYQRKIAEILDNHLSAVQRDHEQISQIEERRIRDDAALEEARRKEKALYEEKVQREKAKEARLVAAKRAEEEQRIALEAARKAAEEAAKKEAARLREVAAAEVGQKAAIEQVGANAEITREKNQVNLITKDSGIRVMAADAALKAEASRLKVCNDVEEKICNLVQKDLDRYGRKMFRIISQITGTQDIVRNKAHELLNIISDPACPRSICILIFAKKVVSLCETPRGSSESTAFACGRAILLVASQVPPVMDFVLAEFHKACIYTVPKYLHPSDVTLQTNDYWKMIGYREDGNTESLEENRKMESSDSYLDRVQSYMKLYAALVQTEIQGIRNPHGLKEGWAWLAMFLNSLPANRVTAVALDAFLRMAGFALFRRYKSQFLKILTVISRNYLPALKRQEDQKMGKIVNRLEEYLDDRRYLREPEGWRLEESLLSQELI